MSLTTQEVLRAINSLYDDRIEPGMGVLRRRLKEQTEQLFQVDKLIPVLKQMSHDVQLIPKQSGACEPDVRLRARPADFVDPTDPEDRYAPHVYAGLEEHLQLISAADPELQFRGGRYGMAFQLKDQPFFRGLCLGEIAHVLQLSLAKKIVGYRKGGTLVYHPYSDATKKIQAQQAALQAAEPDCGPKTITEWAEMRWAIQRLWCENEQYATKGVLLSFLKGIIEERFGMQLSESAFHHDKLSDLLSDPQMAGICTVSNDEQFNPRLFPWEGPAKLKASKPAKQSWPALSSVARGAAKQLKEDGNYHTKPNRKVGQGAATSTPARQQPLYSEVVQRLPQNQPVLDRFGTPPPRGGVQAQPDMSTFMPSAATFTPPFPGAVDPGALDPSMVQQFFNDLLNGAKTEPPNKAPPKPKGGRSQRIPMTPPRRDAEGVPGTPPVPLPGTPPGCQPSVDLIKLFEAGLVNKHGPAYIVAAQQATEDDTAEDDAASSLPSSSSPSVERAIDPLLPMLLSRGSVQFDDVPGVTVKNTFIEVEEAKTPVAYSRRAMSVPNPDMPRTPKTPAEKSNRGGRGKQAPKVDKSGSFSRSRGGSFASSFRDSFRADDACRDSFRSVDSETAFASGMVGPVPPYSPQVVYVPVPVPVGGAYGQYPELGTQYAAACMAAQEMQQQLLHSNPIDGLSWHQLLHSQAASDHIARLTSGSA